MKFAAVFVVGAALGLAIGFPLGMRRVPQATATSGPTEARTAAAGKQVPVEDIKRSAPSEPAKDRPDGETPAPDRPAPPVDAEGIDVTSDAQAWDLLAGGDPKGRYAALLWFRGRLGTASPAEWAEIDRRLSAMAGTWTLAQKAGMFTVLFGNGGAFGDLAGPPLLEGGLRRLLFGLIPDLPQGDDHRGLVKVLSQQMAQENGSHSIQIMDFMKTTLASERARLEFASGTPLGAEGAPLLARELERIAAAGADEHEEMMELLAFGGPGASAPQSDTLMKFATDHPQQRPRLVALLCLAAGGPSPDVDAYCARVASDPNRTIGERLAAWHRLKKQQSEELLSESVRRDIVKAWEESGETDVQELINVK